MAQQAPLNGRKLREAASQVDPAIIDRVEYHMNRVTAIMSNFANANLSHDFLLEEIADEIRDVNTLFTPPGVVNTERVQIMEEQRKANVEG